jgi:quinol monooxygenase YgiN
MQLGSSRSSFARCNMAVLWFGQLERGGIADMATKAIWVMLKAKPGKEAEVEAFLKQGAAMSNDEPATVTWYGVKVAPGVYGVFDTFNDEAGRDAHMNGPIAKALIAKAPDLFSNELQIEKMDILSNK